MEPHLEDLKNSIAVLIVYGLEFLQEHHWHQWMDDMLRFILHKPAVCRWWKFPIPPNFSLRHIS